MFWVILLLSHCCRRIIFSFINFFFFVFFQRQVECLHQTSWTWVVSVKCWLYKISKPVQLAFLGNPNNVVSFSGILFKTLRKSLELQYNVVAHIYQPKNSSLCSWFALKLLALSIWRGGWRLKAILKNEVIIRFFRAFLTSYSFVIIFMQLWNIPLSARSIYLYCFLSVYIVCLHVCSHCQ